MGRKLTSGGGKRLGVGKKATKSKAADGKENEESTSVAPESAEEGAPMEVSEREAKPIAEPVSVPVTGPPAVQGNAACRDLSPDSPGNLQHLCGPGEVHMETAVEGEEERRDTGNAETTGHVETTPVCAVPCEQRGKHWETRLEAAEGVNGQGRDAGLVQDCEKLATELAEGALEEAEVRATHGYAKDSDNAAVGLCGTVTPCSAEEQVDPELIVKALNAMERLRSRKRELDRDIEEKLNNLEFIKGEARALGIKVVAALNRELEEIEEEINRTVTVIKSWEEIVSNRDHFQQMNFAESSKTSFESIYMDFVLKGSSECVSNAGPSHNNSDAILSSETVIDNALPVTLPVTLPVIHSDSSDTIQSHVPVTMENVVHDTSHNKSDAMHSGVTEEGGGEEHGENEGAKKQLVNGGKTFWQKRKFFTRQEGGFVDTPVFKRRNVAKIQWMGEKGDMPGSRYICKKLIKESMGFTVDDIFAFVTISDVEYEVSFKLSQGLDKFWSLYEGKKASPEWNGFKAFPVSKPEVKNVTITFKNESVPPEDVMFWLKRQCTVLSPLTRLYNEEGFWVVGWKVQVRLNVHNNVTDHLPNSFFIGKERGSCFYVGQPKVCFKCGSRQHLAGTCPLKVCVMCGATGHVSKECDKVRCNLCLQLGHTHRQCPEAWHNILKNCPNVESEFSQSDGQEQRQGDGQRESAVLPSNETPEVNLVRHQDQTQTGHKEGGSWNTVGSKSQKSQEESTVLRPDLEISNRFVLLEGNSLQNLTDEEELKRMEKQGGMEVGKLKRKMKSKKNKVSSAVSSPEEKGKEKIQDQPTQGNSEASLEGITEEKGKKRKGRLEDEEEWESFGEEEISYQMDEGCSSGLGKFQYKRSGEKVLGKQPKSPRCSH